MRADGVLELLEEEKAKAMRRARRSAILQPGAIGDCILTLPLAEFIRCRLEIGGLDIFGRTEYIDFLPTRTCIDGIRSIDAMNLHRMFIEPEQFDLADPDPLVDTFAEYCWIVNFLGEPDSAFEQNLIFTANCSHSAEVITLPLQPPENFSGHISEFYINQFIDQCGIDLSRPRFSADQSLVKASEHDKHTGRKFLKEASVSTSANLVVLLPGSGSLHKCWHLGNFLALAERLLSGGFEVIFLLGPAEQERFGKTKMDDINRAAKCLTDLSLTQVLGVLSCAYAAVGNDSGITHLAAALGVRTIAVFGPTNPVLYRPVGPNVAGITETGPAFANEPAPALQQRLAEVLTDFSLAK